MRRFALKAILFDFGGTLDSDGIPWKERFYPLYLQEGVDWDFPDFERSFFASDDSLTREGLGQVDYRTMLFEQVSRVLRAGDRYEPGLAQRISLRFYLDSLRLLERNRPILQRLALQYRLGIVSNFYGNLDFLCREIGYNEMFSAVVDSVRVGAEKPEAGIFRAALELLKCLPAETLVVGDSLPRDMGGARLLGMPHVWLNSRHPELRPCCENDPMIRSLPELEEILA
jgi:HAD superfamily hydrolase (TIGR01509 family)